MRLLDKVTAIANQLLLLDSSLDNPLTRELIWGKLKYKIQKDSYGDMNQIVTRYENFLEALPKRIQEKSGPEKKTFNARHEKPSSDNRSQEKKARKCLIGNRNNHYMSECKTMPNPLDQCILESQDSNDEDARAKTAAAATSPSGGRTTSIPIVQAEAYNPDTSTWESISLMIDTGTDLTFISEKIAKNWKLPIIKKDMFTLTTFKSGKPRPEEYALTKVKLRVPHSNKDLEITPYISNELVGRIKKRVLPPDDMMHILKQNIQMNKDAFETSVPDMIIGDDFVTLFLTGKMVFLPSGMALLDTVFGNTTIGRPRSSPIETDQDGHYGSRTFRK
uniref:DUF1758 domain-containing protein n=1 Tax=Caenorhabditis japonica TaxID=281687 RepID=A0A8R1DLE6_CAEJA